METKDIVQQLFTAIGWLVGGGATSLITYLLTKRYTIEQMTAETRKMNAETKKTEAEARSTDAATIDQLSDTIAEMDTRWRAQRAEDTARIAALESEVQSLKHERDATDAEVKRLQGVVSRWRAGINRLIDQLVKHDIPPVWKPEDDQA